MKVLGTILILATAFIDPGDIRKINSAKSEAKKAYIAGDYKIAIEKYRFLIDSMGVNEDEVRMNLANAYFHVNDTSNALGGYTQLTQSVNKKIKSVAYQQMGVLNNKQGKLSEAIGNFKEALKADPANEDARYNYEMAKKKSEQQKRDEQNKNNQSKEPSAFAKQLKEQADQLVLKKLYLEAHELMTEGLKKDKSVSFYNEFIKRTKTVGDINK